MPIDTADAWGHVLIPYETPFAQHIHKIHVRAMSVGGVWDTPDE